MLLALTILALWTWIWSAGGRKTFGGPEAAGGWAILTGCLLVCLVYQDIYAVSALDEAFPKIMKDFILLGMVGFVQTLAVNKRISVWMAVVLIFGMYAAVYYLDDLIPEGEGERRSYLIELVDRPLTQAETEELRDLETRFGVTLAPAFAPKEGDRTDLDDYLVASVSESVDLSEFSLTELAGVEYAEPNETVLLDPMEAQEVVDRPNPPSIGINDPEADLQWIMGVMKMNKFYQELQRQRPVKRVKIAILDTGVDAQHEDLKDNYVSTDSKYDNDPMGHGTHCAGIAAGVTNNGIGIGSMAFGDFVEVTSIKVLGYGGMGTQKTIIAGIIQAVDEGADVISLSLGGRSTASRQKAYGQAVKYATDKGIIVLAAAGNSSRPAIDHAPANAKGIICVSAVGAELERAGFSNTIRGIGMAVAAPGVGIYSTVPGNEYKVFSGTSMACPFVAGLVAVMKSIRPNLTAEEAHRILTSTGIPGENVRQTGPIVQPAAALRALGG